MALIKLNRSKTGAVPTSLADGELFVEQLNGWLYYADATGVVRKFDRAGSATNADYATNAGNADTVDGHHAGVAANNALVLNAAAKVPPSADKYIISTVDPDPAQGDQNWLWMKV
jgi:hypothetical protein